MAEAYQSLYRRFRPQRFEELKGQDHIAKALRGAVRAGRVAHAYLFSGPRGTGKTSTARILAKALNCSSPGDGEPCGRCQSCLDVAAGRSLDVYELDAASHSGVDAIRDLIAGAPLGSPGEWKVYIIDEVHMLSTAASNALLKTLEEPPDHVVFVLATTDPHKVLPTIRSRTQHFEFHLLALETLESLLQEVSSQAGLEVSEDVIRAAARRGQGSARDALSALDQMLAAGSAETRFGLDVRPVLEALFGGNVGNMIAALGEMISAGHDPQRVAVELTETLRQAFLKSMGVAVHSAAPGFEATPAQIVRAFEALGEAQVKMRDALDARVVLEMTLIRLARPGLDASAEALLERLERLERRLDALTSQSSSHSDLQTPLGHARRLERENQRQGAGIPGSQGIGRRPALGGFLGKRGLEESAERKSNCPDQSPPPPEAPPAIGPSCRNDSDTDSDLSRDDLVAAWGDVILHKLSPRAKASLGQGRFLDVRGTTAIFAVPAPEQARAASIAEEAERELSAHFGVPISFEVVADRRPGTPPARIGRPLPLRVSDPPSSKQDGIHDQIPGNEAPSTEDDTAELLSEVAEPMETVLQRLFEAFPGAEEIKD
jgi:DNA polymerase-3 subunit gamma/tau